MLRHIVAWNLKDDSTGQERAEKIKYVREQLETLYPAVPQLKEIKVVTTEMIDGSNREIFLNTLFDSEVTFKEYMDHPFHLDVVKNISHLLQDRIAVDYVE